MKHIDSVSSLIEALGGNAALARKLNLKHASNVSEMKRRGSIPVELWPGIVKLTASDPNIETIDYEKMVSFHTEKAA